MNKNNKSKTLNNKLNNLTWIQRITNNNSKIRLIKMDQKFN